MANKRKQSRFWTNMRAAETKIITYYLDCTDTVVEAAGLMQMDTAWLYRRMRLLNIPSPRALKAADAPDEIDLDVPDEDETVTEVEDETEPEPDNNDHDEGIVVFPAPVPDPNRDEEGDEGDDSPA
jgi:hypothetical protein